MDEDLSPSLNCHESEQEGRGKRDQENDEFRSLPLLTALWLLPSLEAVSDRLRPSLPSCSLLAAFEASGTSHSPFLPSHSSCTSSYCFPFLARAVAVVASLGWQAKKRRRLRFGLSWQWAFLFSLCFFLLPSEPPHPALSLSFSLLFTILRQEAKPRQLLGCLASALLARGEGGSAPFFPGSYRYLGSINQSINEARRRRRNDDIISVAPLWMER